jgi:hypothetical protein
MGTSSQLLKFEDKNGQYAASKKAYPSQRASHRSKWRTRQPHSHFHQKGRIGD